MTTPTIAHVAATAIAGAGLERHRERIPARQEPADVRLADDHDAGSLRAVAPVEIPPGTNHLAVGGKELRRDHLLVHAGGIGEER